MRMRITDWFEGFNDVCFLAFNQPVEKLVISVLVCLKDFRDHCAGEHNLRPLLSYPSLSLAVNPAPSLSGPRQK